MIMTPEEKAKAYDEALERARKLYNSEETSTDVEIACENIFPELKEGEDEKVRKWLITQLELKSDVNNPRDLELMILKSIAWLENQGEKDKLIKELGEYKVKYIQEVLEKHTNNISNKDDERLREATIAFLTDFAEQGYENAAECIDWLEKQDIFSKKDVDDAYLKGVSDTKNEIEKQYDANYQIRKDIATFLFNYKGDIKDRAKWMNYLGIKVSFIEKQDEKPQGKSAREAINEEKIDNQNCVKPTTDKVEPKFHEGDWVIDKQDIVHQIANVIENVTNHTYGYDIVGGGYFNDNTEGVRLWTIQDAKEGDVLQLGEVTTIFQEYIGHENCKCYCSVYAGVFNIPSQDDIYGCYDPIPATKEQRDLLYQKMKESGYKWDEYKKELKKIEQKRSEWSKRDERIYYSLLADIRTRQNTSTNTLEAYYNEQIEWLKFLKQRIGG